MLSIIWLCLFVHEYYFQQLHVINKIHIRQVLYYHNIHRYLITVGNTRLQPMASDMQLMRWNQSLEKSLYSIANECVLNRDYNNCPPLNVYRIKKQQFKISRIVRAWFNAHRYYDYSQDTCAITSCDFFKRVVASSINNLACTIKKIEKESYFICQYGGITKDRPYKEGAPCSSCPVDHDTCYKGAFCTKNLECAYMRCDDLITKRNDNFMQADQSDFCLPNINCEIAFFKYMCPQICSIIFVPTTSLPIATVNQKVSDENYVCNLASVDCSVEFFNILCPISCGSVLCRDPNIDCKNIFYSKCKKCLLMNETMSDSRMTTTTMPPPIEQTIGLIDPKCQDLPFDNYCIDRGEMCFNVAYEAWMKKFCCNTCTILNICFDYLDLKSPGKCAEVLSSGMCSTPWSQTYCRKSCKQC